MLNMQNDLYTKDGYLYWIKSTNQVIPGDEAGKVDSSGYKRFVYKGSRYLVHRVIYFLHTGQMPKYIDHIDGNKLNNKIENLRPATAQQNAQNRKSFRKLPKNVYLRPYGKYRVAIRLNNKLTFFGEYRTVDEANVVAQEIRNKYHGEFAV